jgi:hypothetical protein
LSMNACATWSISPANSSEIQCKLKTISVLQYLSNQLKIVRKNNRENMYIPKTMTEVVPSPTSSSCVRLSSIIDCPITKKQRKTGAEV